MKIILTQNVKGVGDVGDIKEVATGYASNFLFPKELAKPATKQAIAELSSKKEKKEKKQIKTKKQLHESLTKIDGKSFSIKAKASKADKDGASKLFAAINKKDIVDILEKEGFTVDPKNIDIEKPIKELGTHTILISAGKDSELASVFLNITSE